MAAHAPCHICDDVLASVELVTKCQQASTAANEFVGEIARVLLADPAAYGQFCHHGYAWYATLAEAIQATCDWAAALDRDGRLQDLERLILAATTSEYLAQIIHGIAMSQDEVVRPDHYGLATAATRLAGSYPDVLAMNIERLGSQIVSASRQRENLGDPGLDDTLDMIADQFRKFSDELIRPFAQGWHERDELIPDTIIDQLSELGVFGLTIDEKYGGSGMGKLAMCVVTEELSRGYIGVGSLGTRAEIAGELIQLAGTDAQKNHYLPGIASGDILPAAVFTEPDTGSDLASLRTRAQKSANGWELTGNKTWITHAARSDLMTVLARSKPEQPGHRGLTLFLLDKTRGTDADPFPDDKISGGEIKVLGYRGMKEYTVAFDGYCVPEESALGSEEGKGFLQLMSTFEGARIQTAARAVGVAQCAYDLALGYATERVQFGQPIIEFPRVHGKLARMIIDISAARQLTYAAARVKDRGNRCDIEAGMSKLLAARTAWSCADNALQIHGGNGYATEYAISRVLCDARILNIFEGAAEIQAEVISRGLLKRLS